MAYRAVPDTHRFDISQPVICVVGPTASGKTDLAQRLACALDGEVVSADSMQVYRGMDIGTGKIAPSARLVAHHGLDLVDPGEPYSAALFQGYARRCFLDLDKRGKRAILCGGTGFYVRAAIDDYDFPAGEQTGNAVRDRYQVFAEEHGSRKLWEKLAERDPESAALVPENDVKRVIRAFELLEDGTTYASQRAKLPHIGQCVPAGLIGLDVDPAILRERIDRRVDAMFASGLVDEVKGLLERGFREGVTAPAAIGYKEVVEAIEGRITIDEAKDLVKTATHRYAKRQRTWFRKDARIRWIDANTLNFDDMIARALDIVAKIDGNA